MAKRCTYTEAQRQQLCRQYLSSKQNRREFCESHDISPKSLSRWLLKNTIKPTESKFMPIGELTALSNTITEINLPNGINIRTHLDAEHFHQLIKGLL